MFYRLLLQPQNVSLYSVRQPWWLWTKWKQKNNSQRILKSTIYAKWSKISPWIKKERNKGLTPQGTSQIKYHGWFPFFLFSPPLQHQSLCLDGQSTEKTGQRRLWFHDLWVSKPQRGFEVSSSHLSVSTVGPNWWLNWILCVYPLRQWQKQP